MGRIYKKSKGDKYVKWRKKKASKALESFPKEVAINGKYNRPYDKGKIKI